MSTFTQCGKCKRINAYKCSKYHREGLTSVIKTLCDNCSREFCDSGAVFVSSSPIKEWSEIPNHRVEGKKPENDSGTVVSYLVEEAKGKAHPVGTFVLPNQASKLRRKTVRALDQAVKTEYNLGFYWDYAHV